MKKHLGKTYKRLTKKSHPKERDVLYRLPKPEDGPLDPLKCTVTNWGAENHGEDHHYLIEVVQEYPQSFIEKKIEGLSRKERKVMLQDLTPKRTFLPLECLYKLIE